MFISLMKLKILKAIYISIVLTLISILCYNGYYIYYINNIINNEEQTGTCVFNKVENNCPIIYFNIQFITKHINIEIGKLLNSNDCLETFNYYNQLDSIECYQYEGEIYFQSEFLLEIWIILFFILCLTIIGFILIYKKILKYYFQDNSDSDNSDLEVSVPTNVLPPILPPPRYSQVIEKPPSYDSLYNV